MESIWLWVGFNVFVLMMLAVDLGVFHKEAHSVSTKEAGIWSAVWITLSLIFCYGVYHFMGAQAGTEFLTGYLIEKALSVDNIFVFVLIFSYFRVPPQYQHRILFWGILGALLMRGTMIALGAVLLERFHWIIYVFGAFLVYSGIKMATQKETTVDPEHNPVLVLMRKFIPVTSVYSGQKFFIKEAWRKNGRARRVATPLFVVLVFVETTDLIFALDSIPAIFGVTQDAFIVYTSNVFAILGLRALYFLLAGVIEKFHYLKLGLSLVLVFVGLKMLLESVIHVPTGISLLVVAAVLTVSVVASLLFPQKAEEHAPVEHDPLAPANPAEVRAPVNGSAGTAVDQKELVEEERARREEM